MQKTLAAAAMLLAGCMLAIPRAAAPVSALQAQNPGAHGFTAGPRLAAIYDTILQARVDEARAELARTCPPAPAPACDALAEVSWWWQIQQDEWNRGVDPKLEAAASAAIESTTGWTERDPNSGEAWFYLAGSYAPLSQWRVARGQRLAAAREGKRMKDALERSLSLNPSLQDAWFGIGLYHYYADVAPAALKVLRFLLLLPGGDRTEGLQEMLRARDHGELLRGEADYQLHWIYLWYEQKPDRALQLLRGLDTRYPSNPLFLQRIADVEHVYFSNHRESAGAWQALLDRVRDRRVAFAGIADARARMGLASELIELGEAARAIDLLDPLLRTRPAAPYGATARALLTLGDADAALGRRAAALDAYSRATNEAPQDDPEGVRTRARAAIARLRSQR